MLPMDQGSSRRCKHAPVRVDWHAPIEANCDALAGMDLSAHHAKFEFGLPHNSPRTNEGSWASREIEVGLRHKIVKSQWGFMGVRTEGA